MGTDCFLYFHSKMAKGVHASLLTNFLAANCPKAVSKMVN